MVDGVFINIIIYHLTQNHTDSNASVPGTLFDRLWDEHLVESPGDGADLIYIDCIFLHERTGSIALASLEAIAPGYPAFLALHFPTGFRSA